MSGHGGGIIIIRGGGNQSNSVTSGMRTVCGDIVTYAPGSSDMLAGLQALAAVLVPNGALHFDGGTCGDCDVQMGTAVKSAIQTAITNASGTILQMLQAIYDAAMGAA